MYLEISCMFHLYFHGIDLHIGSPSSLKRALTSKSSVDTCICLAYKREKLKHLRDNKILKTVKRDLKNRSISLNSHTENKNFI